jgi:hypothetical protein
MNKKSVRSVSVSYARNGTLTNANALGMLRCRSAPRNGGLHPVVKNISPTDPEHLGGHTTPAALSIPKSCRSHSVLPPCVPRQFQIPPFSPPDPCGRPAPRGYRAIILFVDRFYQESAANHLRVDGPPDTIVASALP